VDTKTVSAPLHAARFRAPRDSPRPYRRIQHFFGVIRNKSREADTIRNGQAEIGKYLKELFSQTRGGWTLV
jgi:hypothetical protein